AGDFDMAADPAGVDLAPAVRPAVGLAPARLVEALQVVDEGRLPGGGRGGAERHRQNGDGVAWAEAVKKHEAAAFLRKGNRADRGTVYRQSFAEAVICV